MPKKILNIFAEATYGESYRTSKIELDAETSSAQIEYDAPEEILLRHAGETHPPKPYQSLVAQAKNISGSAQILNYFLDGSRHVYKVDDIAYLRGSRKMIYPIVAGQVVTGCCRRVDKRLHEEKFSAEVVLAVPDVTNPRGFDGGFFPALVKNINEHARIPVDKILTYSTARKLADKFEDRAVAKIMEHMHNAEKNLVAELVRRGKLDQKNYLVKDGSLEYRIPPDDKIFELDDYVCPLFEKYFKRKSLVRYVDFNQGLDARLIDDYKMARLAELNIRPMRIAFDHIEQREIYERAIRLAAKHGVRDLSNYILYNFNDTPEDFYNRLRINIDLCEELDVAIYRK